jgi:hypothetical protein
MYSQFPVDQEDRDYEFNAREDYIAELNAEHFDPCWDEPGPAFSDDELADPRDWLDDIDF